MRLMLLLLALIPASVFARTSAMTAEAQRTVSDLIVFGTVEEQEFGEVLDEFGMNIAIKARLRITRVEAGRPPSSVLTVRYITHTALPKDREIRFRLRRTSDGTYLVCSEGGRGYTCSGSR